MGCNLIESGTPGGGAAVEADLAGAVAHHPVAAAVGAHFTVEALCLIKPYRCQKSGTGPRAAW